MLFTELNKYVIWFEMLKLEYTEDYTISHSEKVIKI